MTTENTINGDLLVRGQRFCTPQEVAAFWTDRRLEIAEWVYENVNWLLQDKFGGPEAIPFSPKSILLTADSDSEESIAAGTHHPLSGWITININRKESEWWFAQVIAHEVCETRAHRLSYRNPAFTFIDEAVVETTSSQLLHDALPKLKRDSEPATYKCACDAVAVMCKRIFYTQQDKFSSPQEVLEQLQASIFRNEHEDFFDILKKTYGPHGDDFLMLLGYFGEAVGDQDLTTKKEGNDERYKWLLKFLRGEKFELFEAMESISASALRFEKEKRYRIQIKEKEGEEQARKRRESIHAHKEVVKDDTGKVIMERFRIKNRTIEVDYAQVPEDIPVEDSPNEVSYHTWGVRTRVNQAMDFIHAQLNGHQAHGSFLRVGKLPEARGAYVPTESDIVDHRVNNTAYELLSQALGVQEQPDHELLHVKRNDKAEFHEATALTGVSPDGYKVYFLHVYRTQKVYKKDERRVLRDKANVFIQVMTPQQVEKWVDERKLWY